MYSVADVKSVKSFLGFVLIKCCLLSYIVVVLLLKFADLMFVDYCCFSGEVQLKPQSYWIIMSSYDKRRQHCSCDVKSCDVLEALWMQGKKKKTYGDAVALCL